MPMFMYMIIYFYSHKQIYDILISYKLLLTTLYVWGMKETPIIVDLNMTPFPNMYNSQLFL